MLLINTVSIRFYIRSDHIPSHERDRLISLFSSYHHLGVVTPLLVSILNSGGVNHPSNQYIDSWISAISRVAETLSNEPDKEFLSRKVTDLMIAKNNIKDSLEVLKRLIEDDYDLITSRFANTPDLHLRVLEKELITLDGGITKVELSVCYPFKATTDLVMELLEDRMPEVD